MKSKAFLSFVVAIGVCAASSSWAVGSESSGGGHVPGGVAVTVVAGTSGLIYGGQGVATGRVAYGSGYMPAEAGQGKATAGVERSAADDTEGGPAQILTGLALVLVLVGKRISG